MGNFYDPGSRKLYSSEGKRDVESRLARAPSTSLYSCLLWQIIPLLHFQFCICIYPWWWLGACTPPPIERLHLIFYRKLGLSNDEASEEQLDTGQGPQEPIPGSSEEMAGSCLDL